jgi:N6-adenosine-specific RNA methylase IME4
LRGEPVNDVSEGVSIFRFESYMASFLVKQACAVACADWRALYEAVRREHSRNPACVHERIERLVAGPRLELFARCSRDGWTCVGDEIDRFSEVAA